jgi:hypothetical protein
MKNIFKYSLLKYIHSDLLGESLNIGILFIFEKERQLIFKYPNNYARIRAAYGSNFSDSIVNGTLRGILKQIPGFNKVWGQSPSGQQSIDFMFAGNNNITDRFLHKDSTVLRFDDVRASVSYGEPEQMASDFYKLYFSHYDEHVEGHNRHDEEYISKNIKTLLQKGNPEYHQHIRKNAIIEVPLLPEGEFEFDFSWKNEVIHYVKPIGFDFQDSKSINQKAATYFGYLSAIAEEIGNNSVDVVTATPQNKALWKSFDKAVEMIDSVNIKKNIILQKQYQSYAEEILENIEKHK